jgi:hypothetical protein
MNADPSEETGGEPDNLFSEGKIREFCFELALALRRITGRKITHGLEELPPVIREAIKYANEESPDLFRESSEEEMATSAEGDQL